MEGVPIDEVTVLLVEDEDKIRQLIREFLEQRGYSVLEAASGDDGLAQFGTGHPDLVVLDLMLPRLDGMEVCRRIRRQSAVPIIMLTARSEELDKLLGLELGADDYMTKPFSVRELEARMRAVLRRTRCSGGEAGEVETEVIRAGDLRIDVTGQRVTLGGRDVHLTPTEFRLLVTLASNPGRVYSRMQLLDAAFGETYVGYERSIDTHISNLRKKLERDPADPAYITTVYGFGYRFEEDD